MSILGMLTFGTSVYAAEQEEAPSPVVSSAELTEEERQIILNQISQKLEEVERELIRLSLLVTKLALEEQALALEQQLLIAQTKLVEPAESPEASEPDDQAVAIEETQGPQEPFNFLGDGSEEDVFSAIAFEQEEGQGEEEEEKKGFLAALGSFGNLGTPELAVLIFLVVLILFTVVRRARGRKQSPPKNISMQAPQQPRPSSQVQGDAIQEGKEELKERIVWE